jgi:hypothetical protein
MKIFHDDKYYEQKKALWLYFIFEVLAYTIMLAFDILVAVTYESLNEYSLLNLVNLSTHFFFPTIQAVGICFLKDSIDPLSNVSTLSFYKLVSINQIPTESFLD